MSIHCFPLRFQLVDFGLAHLEPGKPPAPPTSSSSSSHVTKSPLTSSAHTPKPRINGTSIIPPVAAGTHGRQLHAKGGGKGRGRGRKKVEERGMDSHACPLRHASSAVCDTCMSRSAQSLCDECTHLMEFGCIHVRRS